MRTLTEQADAIRSGSTDPEALVRDALERAEEVEHATNAFTTVLPDKAMDRAKRLAKAEPAGPLHGVPVAVKDLYDVAGARTTGCCAAFDRMSSTDSVVVDKLQAAGAIVVAKTNQHELALGTDTQLSTHGPARNPWDLDRSPGGSSGGSGIAVATGVVAAAMGSDTGGSIRIPASFCGVTGLKPTHGAVSTRGGMALAPSLDTFGPLAVTAADCALVHRVISGYDPKDRWSRRGPETLAPRSIEGLRVVVGREWIEAATEEVASAIHAAAAQLAELGVILEGTDSLPMQGARDLVGPLLLAEAAHTFEDILEDKRLTQASRGLLQVGKLLGAGDYIDARDAYLDIRRVFDGVFESADALIVPTTPYVAPRIGQDTVPTPGGDLPTDARGTTLFTLPMNAAGLPALSLPVGVSSEGMPIAAQIVGPAWTEERLCALGAAYQAVTEWHLGHPSSAKSG